MAQSIADAISQIQAAINQIGQLNRIVISGRRKGFSPSEKRIDIRPVTIREKELLQLVSHDGKRDLTKNLGPEEIDIPEIVNQGYANVLIEKIDSKVEIRFSKSGQAFIHHAEAVVAKNSRVHDQAKPRLLGEVDSFYSVLGLADKSGAIKPSRRDKFVQIDNFLRIIDSSLPESENISIVDLGCGNAYLTFAIHHYLTKKGKKVRTIGVDVKAEARSRNNAIAQELGYSESIEFVAAEIDEFPIRDTEIVIALHACDTATDDAIVWGVRSKAKLMLIAPCCHHNLNQQLTELQSPFAPLGHDGLVRERFADLITDSLRAQILRTLGYKTEIIEFVSGDHTPRNLLIRAKFRSAESEIEKKESLLEIDYLLKQFSVQPYLLEVLSKELSIVPANQPVS